MIRLDHLFDLITNQVRLSVNGGVQNCEHCFRILPAVRSTPHNPSYRPGIFSHSKPVGFPKIIIAGHRQMTCDACHFLPTMPVTSAASALSRGWSFENSRFAGYSCPRIPYGSWL